MDDDAARRIAKLAYARLKFGDDHHYFPASRTPRMRMTSCRCETVTHLSGRAGQDYARAHLTEVRVDADKWLILHRCPATGRYWLEWFPDSGAHGGGVPEFRQIAEAEIPELFGDR